MESYIKNINHSVITKHQEKAQKKIKFTYQMVGGFVLAIGMGGFISAFITFMVLFFNLETDAAMTAWIVSVPFILMIVAGSVLARIGDMMLKDFVEKEYQEDKKRERERKEIKNDRKNASKWSVLYYKLSEISFILSCSILNSYITFFPFDIAKTVKGSIT